MDWLTPEVQSLLVGLVAAVLGAFGGKHQERRRISNSDENNYDHRENNAN